MLRELHIENIAVIEKADIEFNRGLNVLCGETGAGKSIIIDSLNAVLGNRASKELVRRGAEQARVTAVFESEQANAWLEENDIPSEDDLILQRRITPDGKSSCRVNGIPVSASQLKELAAMLVDIHGQNDGLRLLDERSHLGFLDRFSDNNALIDAYKEEYNKFLTYKKEIDSLTLDETEKLQLSDSLHYKIDELERADIKCGEYENLRNRRDMMRNSEKLREALDSTLQFLSENEESVVSGLQNAQHFADRAASFSPDLEKAAAALNEASFTIFDAAEIFSDFRDQLNFSPDEYDELEKRINVLDRLQRKYNCDEAGLIELIDESRKKLDEIEYADERLEKLHKLIEKQKAVCVLKASELSAGRKKAAKKLEERVIGELKALNMPSVRFEVEFAPVNNEEGFNSAGCDDVRFIMSANAGESLGRISKIASGGEMSRIMLSLKNVFAERDIVETMIFDEIDTGVSGISAQRVAEKLYSVSKNKQVMCVTHLPQIAAMADSQYVVEKQERDGRTFTNVTLLDDNGRKREIARLYGGDNIGETTLAAAEEQLVLSKKFKNITV